MCIYGGHLKLGPAFGSALASQMALASLVFPIFQVDFRGQFISAEEANELRCCFDSRRPP
jgi:hypothetical protein